MQSIPFNDIPQTLTCLDPSMLFITLFQKPNFVGDSPNFSYPPPQPQFETYLCELCGNNAHYGYDCSPQFPFVYEQEPYCNIWGSEVRKKEQAYEEEKYSAACRYMLSVTCDDEDDYIPSGDIIARYSTSKSITPDLPIEEPDNSLKMGDEHLDTIPAMESDEVISLVWEIPLLESQIPSEV
ncbi:hypothetical protein Tco_1338807 [Tanacetum coccineum]